MADDGDEQCHVCERRVPTRDVYCLVALDREQTQASVANMYCAKCYRTHRACVECAELIDTDEGYRMSRFSKRLTCTHCARPCPLCGHVYNNAGIQCGGSNTEEEAMLCDECKYLATRSPALAASFSSSSSSRSSSSSFSSSSDTLVLAEEKDEEKEPE